LLNGQELPEIINQSTFLTLFNNKLISLQRYAIKEKNAVVQRWSQHNLKLLHHRHIYDFRREK
jgi:hypothetical protein